ncbi:pyruvate, water dikinase regulatory protein [Desulfofalx alkaliphila]|uniref:pyruvate, water dikinase regulatory protein n=1 Tax=Desulfofalx alkaliphila TaxID=105483 RepID=UPI000AA49F6A
MSDSIGDTAELVVKAAVSQFNDGGVEIKRIPYVNDIRDIIDVVEEASATNSIIAYTLVIPELRDALVLEASRYNIPLVDIMGPILSAIESVTHKSPKFEPGLVRRLDEEYFRRVEAIEFAVKYDDGKDPRGITKADLIVLGVSRTSKTPLSMYLAHKRIKVANVPLVPEVCPPDEIFHVSPNKVIGLTIRPQQLNVIRQERLRTLGLTSHADYASMERILKELEYAEGIMKRVGCTVIDVTNKAVEETASKVLELYYRGKRNNR